MIRNVILKHKLYKQTQNGREVTSLRVTSRPFAEKFICDAMCFTASLNWQP